MLADSSFSARAYGESFIAAEHIHGGEKAVGIFSVKGETASVPVALEDGVYTDRISGKKVEVLREMIRSCGEPVIIFSSDKE